MIRPLGLPVGSVRALLLLCLGARTVLEVRDAIQEGTSAGAAVPLWHWTALVLCAAAYFAARSATNEAGGGAGGAPAPSVRGHPLGLPAGTIRLLFLGALGYAAFLWFSQDTQRLRLPVFWVLGAFVLGIVLRLILRRFRDQQDYSARFFDHLLALVSLLAGAGLVLTALEGVGADTTVPDWGEPLLACIVTHYFAAR